MLCSALHLLLFDAWQLVPVDSLATRRHRSILNCAKRSNTGNIKRQVSESVCYFATVLNVYQAINDSTKGSYGISFYDYSFLPLKKLSVQGITQMSTLNSVNLDIGLTADLYSDPERYLQGFEARNVACRI
jgi:hypothetical protein